MVGRCHFLNLGGVSIVWKPLRKPRGQRGYENRCNRLCLCVAYFALVWFAMTEWHVNGAAGGFLDLKNSAQGLSPNGEMFLAAVDPRASMSLLPNPFQGFLLVCTSIIQLMSIWMPKKL